MKTIFAYPALIIFLVFSLCVTAQNGGINIETLNVSNSIEVGSASGHVAVERSMVSLPPLSNNEIRLISNPAEGAIVYSSESDVVLCFDGTWWRRVDGENDEFLSATPPCEGVVFTDQNSNNFIGVEIGTQCWMGENLKVINFPNGDPIPLITNSDAQWASLLDSNSDVAYCYYNNELDSVDRYGHLYSYAAAIALNWTKDNTDDQGICPDGWHLPSYTEWSTLKSYITDDGHSGSEGSALKSVNYWNNDGNGTDDYGFTGLPGGARREDTGGFSNCGYYGNWWMATQFDAVDAWFVYLTWMTNSMYLNRGKKSQAFSVRCVRN